MILRVMYKFHIGWMDGILGEVDGRQGKPSDVGEELGELVDGLQISQHMQSESMKTHPVKGLKTYQRLSVHRTHIQDSNGWRTGDPVSASKALIVVVKPDHPVSRPV